MIISIHILHHRFSNGNSEAAEELGQIIRLGPARSFTPLSPAFSSNYLTFNGTNLASPEGNRCGKRKTRTPAPIGIPFQATAA